MGAARPTSPREADARGARDLAPGAIVVLDHAAEGLLTAAVRLHAERPQPFPYLRQPRRFGHRLAQFLEAVHLARAARLQEPV